MPSQSDPESNGQNPAHRPAKTRLCLLPPDVLTVRHQAFSADPNVLDRVAFSAAEKDAVEDRVTAFPWRQCYKRETGRLWRTARHLGAD